MGAALRPLSREFFERPVLEVAPDLLGVVLTHAGVSVRLCEVEAYDGANDPGSHAYRGQTSRNTTMFGPAGHLYVYFSYGVHWCANVVCGRAGEASAVLLRAGEVVDGDELARQRRGAAVAERDLARGPARLTQALGVSGGHDGVDLFGGPVQLAGPHSDARPISSGPRVGLRAAADRPWRFWLEGDRYVSAYRPAARLAR
ncbi:MAG: DNA-3-methyladenine glycosylase [Nocardioidaceae bacterium]